MALNKMNGVKFSSPATIDSQQAPEATSQPASQIGP
jgi:hypothetical protein